MTKPASGDKILPSPSDSIGLLQKAVFKDSYINHVAESNYLSVEIREIRRNIEEQKKIQKELLAK